MSMYKVHFSSRFKKDFKKVNKSSNFKLKKFIEVVDCLKNNKKLNKQFKNHSLSGIFKDCKECHLQANILLIYSIEKENNAISLLRIGSHSELF